MAHTKHPPSQWISDAMAYLASVKLMWARSLAIRGLSMAENLFIIRSQLGSSHKSSGAIVHIYDFLGDSRTWSALGGNFSIGLFLASVRLNAADWVFKWLYCLELSGAPFLELEFYSFFLLEKFKAIFCAL